jgi:hypothetical protein
VRPQPGFYNPQYNLPAQLAQVNRTHGMLYQAGVGGLFGLFGRDAVVKELVASYTGNVVSIATAPGWFKPRNRARLARQAG